MDNTFYSPDVEDWHAWLQANHLTSNQVWLIYYKKTTRLPSISYEDSVDEALCFGWIDIRVRRIDDERYAILFTPRRVKSHWSESNQQRVRKLIKEGRMTPAGMVLVTFPLDETSGTSQT